MKKIFSDWIIFDLGNDRLPRPTPYASMLCAKAHHGDPPARRGASLQPQPII